MRGFAICAKKFKRRPYPIDSRPTLHPRDSTQIFTTFAEAVVELQEKRHSADYDVMIRMNRSDAALAIATAQAALNRFKNASEPQRLAFLSLLLFPPR